MRGSLCSFCVPWGSCTHTCFSLSFPAALLATWPSRTAFTQSAYPVPTQHWASYSKQSAACPPTAAFVFLHSGLAGLSHATQKAPPEQRRRLVD